MTKLSKALVFLYGVILANVLLLGLYVQNHSKHKVSLVVTKETTTMSNYENASESATYSSICGNATRTSLKGPVRPKPERAAELYWIESNLSRPMNDYEHILGESTAIPIDELKKRSDVLKTRRDCTPTHTVAIIIPFRKREQHLQILIGHLFPILRRQGIQFTVIVAEQYGTSTFNKGRLMNTAFEFAVKLGIDLGNPFDCFIFHDVDLLVEHDTLPYRCADSDNAVKHLSTAIDKFQYKILCCGMTVGGVIAFREHQFRKVNGYPNSLWGWGGEDDDINARIKMKHINIERPKQELGRYTMIRHTRDKLNPMNVHRYSQLMSTGSRMLVDGLTDLDTKIIKVELYPLFVKIVVKVGLPPAARSSVLIRVHKKVLLPTSPVIT